MTAARAVSAENPELSIVIIIGTQRERSQRALESVLTQKGVSALEVVLVDCGPVNSEPISGANAPGVRYIRPGAGTTFAEARAMGAESARASIVAYLEEHCLALPGWAAALSRAFDGPWAGVGGEVHNANPGVGMSNTSLLVNYLHWMAPAIAGECRQIPGQNSAYRREVLTAYRDRLAELLVNDTVFQWALLKDGYRLAVAPDARFAHINETSLRSLGRGHYYWNRCLSPARAELFEWSRSRRWIIVALTPLVPWVRLTRQLWRVLRHRTQHLGTAARNAHLLLACNYCSAAGQMMGLLFGPGDAGRRLSDYELTEDR